MWVKVSSLVFDLCFTFGYCCFETFKVVVYVELFAALMCFDTKKACFWELGGGGPFVYCDIQESQLVFALFMGEFDSSVNYGCELGVGFQTRNMSSMKRLHVYVWIAMRKRGWFYGAHE